MLERLFKSRCLQAAAVALLAFGFASKAQSSGTRDNPSLLSGGGGQARLVLFINGPGRVLPFHDGQMLEVGLDYKMTALAQPGSVFTGWNQVNISVITTTTVNESGIPSTITTTNLSPLPISVRTSNLHFTPQPVFGISDGIMTITQTQAWQANFVRR